MLRMATSLGLFLVLGLPRLANAKPAKLPDIEEVLEQAGWTITPEMSAAYSQPGDIFDGNNSLLKRGSDCFEARVQEGAYASMEVNRSLEAGVRMKVRIPGVRAGMGIEKKLIFDSPTHRQIPRLDLVPTEACLKSIQRAQGRGQDISNWYVVTDALSAVVQKQECGSFDVKAGTFVISGNAKIQQMCEQTSLAPVAVAYKTQPLTSLVPTVSATASWLKAREPGADSVPRSAAFSAICKESDHCLYLAVVHDDGLEGVTVDKSKALSFYEAACKKGGGHGCYFAGERYYNGVGVRQNYQAGKAAFETGCRLGHARSCASLAQSYIREGQLSLAKSLAAGACEVKGDGYGCFLHGWLMENPKGEKTKRRKIKYSFEAIRAYERSCEALEPIGCYILGKRYYSGTMVPRDRHRAKQLFSKACEEDEEGLIGCTRLRTDSGLP